MPYLNGIITLPITTKDIGDALGLSARQIGYLASNVHGRTNKWAKNKPVEFNTRNPITDSQRHQTNYGIRPGVMKDSGAIGSLTRIEDVQKADWYYEPPSTIFRMRDFDHYFSEAQPTIQTRLKSPLRMNQFNGGSYKITFDIIEEDLDNLNLAVDDLDGLLNGYYYAAALKGSGTNNAWREYRGSNLLSDPGGGVTINVAGLSRGQYQLALFLSDSPTPGEGDYLALPHDSENETWLTVNVVFEAPFEFELDYVARNLNGDYLYINDLTEYFPMPGSMTLYFKGVFRCLEPASRFITDTVLNGKSDMFEGGTKIKALHNQIMDGNKKVINSIDMSGMEAGDEIPVYIKWDGYAPEYEPEQDIVIDGALEILYNYGSTSQEVAYVGGSPGFEVIS